MTVFVNAIMYYKVQNPIHAVANVDDYGASARLLAATTLRNVLGTLNLGDILSQREIIAKEMQVEKNLSRNYHQPTKFAVRLHLVFVHFHFLLLQDTLIEGTAAWGVMVERVEVMVIPSLISRLIQTLAT